MTQFLRFIYQHLAFHGHTSDVFDRALNAKFASDSEYEAGELSCMEYVEEQ